MEPLHVLALAISALLLLAAATLELLGAWRFTIHLRNLLKERSSNTPNS